MTFKSQHISVSINRSTTEVYEFVSNPENLPQWAAGLSGSIKKVDDDWVADSPMGTSFLKFAASGKVREAYSKYVSPNFRHHRKVKIKGWNCKRCRLCIIIDNREPDRLCRGQVKFSLAGEGKWLGSSCITYR